MSTPVFNRSAQHKKGPPPVKRRPKKRVSAKHSQPRAIPTKTGQSSRGKSSFLNTLLQFDNDEATSPNTGLTLQVEQDDPSNTLLGVRNLSDTSFTSRNYSNNSNTSSSAGELREIQRQGEEIKRRKEENQRLLNRHNKKKFKPVRVEEEEEQEADTPLIPMGERVTPIYETDQSTPLLFIGGKKKKTRKKKTKRRRTKKKSLFKKKKIGKKRKKKKTKKRKTTRRKGRY